MSNGPAPTAISERLASCPSSFSSTVTLLRPKLPCARSGQPLRSKSAVAIARAPASDATPAGVSASVCAEAGTEATSAEPSIIAPAPTSIPTLTREKVTRGSIMPTALATHVPCACGGSRQFHKGRPGDVHPAGEGVGYPDAARKRSVDGQVDDRARRQDSRHDRQWRRYERDLTTGVHAVRGLCRSRNHSHRPLERLRLRPGSEWRPGSHAANSPTGP